MELSKFCMEHLFHSRRLEDGTTVYWRETKENDAWIVIWEDGESLHTYHDPEEWLK